MESSVDVGSILEGVGPDQFDKLLQHLEVLELRGVKLSQVAIWRQAFLGGAADHHTVVYEYRASSGCHMSLKVDWGREGLAFKDCPEDPSLDGDIIMRKWCRMRPAELRAQLLDVKGREYVLTTWNCQHFSQMMFDRACETSQALTKVSTTPQMSEEVAEWEGQFSTLAGRRSSDAGAGAAAKLALKAAA